MIKFKKITVRNFMSIGNVTQEIDFSQNDLVLVLGENLDLGGNDNRNGVGKSTILNALSYVLYGAALSTIKRDNLINKVNLKNMLVTLELEVDGSNYTIERGRKPGIFKLVKDGKETDQGVEEESNESQGENRYTQMEIERILGMSHDMFKHILALNTSVKPFLDLGAADQRTIIEQLLGITKLSEKADKLKEDIKAVKDEIKEEEMKISAITEANKRIENNINSLKEKSKNWNKSKEEKIQNLQNSILELMNLNIDDEIALHKNKQEAKELTTEYNTLNRELLSVEKEISEKKNQLEKIKNLINSSGEKICPTCNQGINSETHKHIHDQYSAQKNELENNLSANIEKQKEVKSLIKSVKSLIPKVSEPFYKNIDEAYNHKNILDNLGNKLSSELETNNPYDEQIETLSKDGIQEIKFDVLNDLSKLKDHQEFLFKLLTSKDSFIRKNIIDQNLNFLNNRLSQYLHEMGLPHSVKFKSDLEVEISMYGKDFDFDNLSRGEKTRLSLSLSMSFRDVFESMNNKVNLLFIDELLDQGLDTSGVESAVSILKKMSREHKRNVFLISHRDELIGRVSNVLKVIKSGGFTEFENNSVDVN